MVVDKIFISTLGCTLYSRRLKDIIRKLISPPKDGENRFSDALKNVKSMCEVPAAVCTKKKRHMRWVKSKMSQMDFSFKATLR